MKHSHRKNPAKPLLALALACGLLAAASAHAQNRSHPLVLAAYTNAPGGTDLTAGRYAAALVQINRGAGAAGYRGAATHTNLCVAYLAMRDLPAAHAECNAAVVAAQAEERGLSGWTFNGKDQPNSDLAVVYSNRAVLCDVEADPQAAARDLAQAVAFAPGARFVRRNLEAVRSVNGTATAARAQ